METPERAVVRDALDRLKPYLAVWIQDQISRSSFPGTARKTKLTDLQDMVKLVITQWDPIFSTQLRAHARTYFFELKDLRNRWAHEDDFSKEDVSRAIDTVRQILRLIGAPDIHDSKPGSSPRNSVKPRLARERRPTQREMMRSIFKRVGNDEDRLVAEYAAAEKRGDVVRKRNKHSVLPEDYARALLRDAAKKGWLDV